MLLHGKVVLNNLSLVAAEPERNESNVRVERGKEKMMRLVFYTAMLIN